jgi:hypothetical protein
VHASPLAATHIRSHCLYLRLKKLNETNSLIMHARFCCCIIMLSKLCARFLGKLIPRGPIWSRKCSHTVGGRETRTFKLATKANIILVHGARVALTVGTMELLKATFYISWLYTQASIRYCLVVECPNYLHGNPDSASTHRRRHPAPSLINGLISKHSH